MPPEDFRDLRRNRQQQGQPPSQGVVVPENVYQVTSGETVKPDNSENVTQITDYQVIKTSFYPTQEQLEKLDDLAGEYNKKYRRQRKRIDRQDIVRYLIDKCNLESLTDLQT
jgi:hypothetical protein